MLQDAIFARASWLSQPGNEDVAVRFLKASFQGWIYCRANPADCVQYTLKNGSTLGAGHQTWQMNEINALIWPSPNGIGIMDPGAVAADGGRLSRGRDHQGGAAGRRLPDRPGRRRRSLRSPTTRRAPTS